MDSLLTALPRLGGFGEGAQKEPCGAEIQPMCLSDGGIKARRHLAMAV